MNLPQPLTDAIIATVRARQPMTPRQVARLLARHAAYQDILRDVERLLTAGVLSKKPRGATFVVYVNEIYAT